MRAPPILAVVLLAASAAGAEPLILVPDDCAPLAIHRPAADVAYRAGIDAYGRAVVPADLPGGPVPVIDAADVGVPIEVPIVQADEVGGGAFEGFDATAEIGTVTVDADGTTRLDGRILAQQVVLPPGCRRRP